MFSKVLGIILLGLLGFVLLSVIAFYIVANSSLSIRILEQYDRSFMDADIELSDFSIHGISSLGLSIDSLRIIYPHGTFPEVKGKHLEGIGPQTDTLLSVNHIYLRFKPLNMVRLRNFSVPEARIEGLRFFNRKYDDSTSNLSVFRPAPKDSTEKSGTIKFVAGNITVSGNTLLEYYDGKRGSVARLSFDSLGVGGMVKFDPDGVVLRKVHVSIDSLNISSSVNTGKYEVFLPMLWLDEPRPGEFKLSLDAETYANSRKFGKFRAPLIFDADVGMTLGHYGIDISLHDFDGLVAYMPIHVSGKMKFGKRKPYFNLSVSAPSCPLDTLISEYGAFVPGLKDFLSMDGRLQLDVDMDGSFSHGTFPEMSVRAVLPRSGIAYKPQSLLGNVSLDLDAVIDTAKVVDADLNFLKCVGEGFDVSVHGGVSGLLSGDPSVSLDASIAAQIEKAVKSMHFDLPVIAGGDMMLDIKGNFKMSDVRSMSFNTSAVEGNLVSDALLIDTDSLKIKAYKTKADISSSRRGLMLHAGADSLYLDSGSEISARVRNTDNEVSFAMAPRPNGELTPKIYVKSDNGQAFVKFGPHRFFGRALYVDASAQRKSSAFLLRRNLLLDSLQRVYPDVPRTVLLSMVRDSVKRMPSVPDFLSDKAFEKADIDISLDTSKARLLRQWRLLGNVSMKQGGFASNLMPLRTRFSGLNLHYDGNNLKIDTLGIVCGSSDIGIRGYADGLGRALLRKSHLVLYADIDSKRINLNEIVSALEVGKDKIKTARKDAEDLSFITDTLQDVVPELPPLKLVVLPANVNAEINANVDSLDFAYISLSPLKAKALMKERTIQFIDSGFLSEYGSLSLDAFYSTLSRKDISAGANLSLFSLDAGQIISVIPSVDTLIPALKTFKGLFDCRLSATTKLDTNMNVISPTMDALLKINGTNLHIDDAGSLRKITSLLLFKNKNIGDISDFSVSAVIHDNKLEVFPFAFSVDRYKLALWGMQGIDRSLFYHVSILKSPLLFNFGINVYGTLDKMRWNLTTAKYKDGNIPSFTTELDAMQFNISDYVRNIFSRGVSKIDTYNRQQYDYLRDKEEKLNISTVDDSQNLSSNDFKKIDKALVEYQLKQEAENLDSEVEKALAESYKQTSEMLGIYMSDFEDSAYDKKIRRKMERINRKDKEKPAE